MQDLEFIRRMFELIVPSSTNNQGGTVEQQVVTAAKSLFGADICVLFGFNPITKKYAQTVSNEIDSERLQKSLSIPREDGITRLILERRIVLLDDLASKPFFRNSFTDEYEITSMAAVGLYSRSYQRPLAVIYLDYKERREFDALYQTRLDLFAGHAATLLEFEWLLKRYQKLLSIGQLINQQFRKVVDLFDHLREHVPEIIDTSDSFYLAEHNFENGRLNLYVLEHGSYFELRDEINEGLTRQAIDSQEEINISNLREVEESLPEQPVQVEGTSEERI